MYYIVSIHYLRLYCSLTYPKFDKEHKQEMLEFSQTWDLCDELIIWPENSQVLLSSPVYSVSTELHYYRRVDKNKACVGD